MYKERLSYLMTETKFCQNCMKLSRFKKIPETTYMVIKSDLFFIFFLYMIPRNLKQVGIRNKCYPCPAAAMSLGPLVAGKQTLRGT